jgi:hypothetical protein
MAEEQLQLSAMADEFVTSLGSSDWHLGVIAADAPELVGDPPVLDSTVAGPAELLATRLLLGGDGPDDADGLATLVAATSAPVSETNNAGFAREDALLIALIISDHDAPSASLQDSDFDGEVWAIVPETASGYLNATSSTGGTWQSVEDDDWFPPIIVYSGMHSSFQLSHPADQADSECPIKVTVNSQVADGWSYDPCYAQIVFDEEHVPERESRIEVTYCPTTEPDQCD